jgi:hypothetical protein
MTDAPPRLAVLIDGENVQPRYVDGLFARIAGLGEASYRCVYGRLGDRSRMAGWKTMIERHGLELREPYLIPKSERRGMGPNAADIAMTVAAMDLLRCDWVEGFCLASSDSDFTPLVARLRSAKLPVYGFGTLRTSRHLVRACTAYFDLEEPGVDLRAGLGRGERRRILPPEEAVAPLLKALARATGPDGWADLDALKEQLALLPEGFRPGWYGYGKLGRLMLKTGRFEAETRHGSSRVRAKEIAPAG